MCGIFGYVGSRLAAEILLKGLRKLEYRGYDSAGLAVVDRIGSAQGVLHRIRAKGKLHNLERKVQQSVDLPPATLGISHTRWATHGKAEEYNAHPHLDQRGRVAVIQNGIVENYRALRQQLQAAGVVFASDTDTEVIPHLVRYWLDQGYSLLEAVQATVTQLEGSFALAVVSADHPGEVIAARHHAPLAIGYGRGEAFLASDVCAFLDATNRALVLDNGEIARLTPTGIDILTFTGQPVDRSPAVLDWNPVMVEKQGYRHFMLKEIHEQPATLRAGLADRISLGSPMPVRLGLGERVFEQTRQIHIVACGTSWHAALVGKYLLEQWAQIPTQVHYASEYRYSPPPKQPGSLLIGVTQSGETADTLAALQLGRQRGDYLLGITNRLESSVGRLVDECLDLRAGVEIGVAATKTFTAQLLAFYLLALDFSQRRATLPLEHMEAILQGLQQLPTLMEGILESQARYIEELAHRYTETRDFIYLGRGINYPIALEGALKLKEISYIHAEGYPAGEMKHGPIALLDRHVPVVAIAVPGSVYEKVLSNAQEAKARDAQLIGVVAAEDYSAAETFDVCLPVPRVPEILSPFVTVMPLQLLAYAVAALKGLDVDQPRNLAKSVTVE
ncbi:MAG: glutamine--fructose-6-phosphate transaminase (isomerizing) [Thermostichales cyanobacterium GMQP_bins_62]